MARVKDVACEGIGNVCDVAAYISSDVTLGRGRGVREYIRKRVLDVSAHIVRTKATVREAARVFGVSKSTVHKDLTERLPRIDQTLAKRVKRVLDFNKAERHIRGGLATRQKYMTERLLPKKGSARKA